MSKKTYILRVWIDGQIYKEIGPMERKEALKTYWKWDETPNCGPELLENGRHMTIAEVERMDRQRPKHMPPMVISKNQTLKSRNAKRRAQNGKAV